MAVDNLLAALMGRKECFSDTLFAPLEFSCDRTFPLDAMFLAHFPDAGNREALRALSLVATLYLSVFHSGFPQPLFRSAVTFLRENVSLPSFNCNHYEQLYARLSADESVSLPLFEDIGSVVPKELTRTDVYDAFDFLTNGV